MVSEQSCLVKGWILQENLYFFFDLLSKSYGFPWTYYDWDAVRFGTQDSSYEQNRWFEYETETLIANLAQTQDSLKVHVRIRCLSSREVTVQAAIKIMQYFHPDDVFCNLVLLVETLFESPRVAKENILATPLIPNEPYFWVKQDALEYFGDTHWKEWLYRCDFSVFPLVNWYLCKEAQRYFLPAYLLGAIQVRDIEVLSYMLKLCDIPLSTFSPLQLAIIEAIPWIIASKPEH